MQPNETTWKERISYGLSDTASNLIYQMIIMYLMFFYTDVYGISAAAVGTLFLVSRIIDAFDSPIFGVLIDRTNSKWGKSRPWLLWLAVPFGIIGVLAFSTPDFGDTGKLVYAYITYILLGILYAGINIPITSILPSLTSNLNERNVLVSTRMILASVGVTIVSLGALPLVDFLGNGDQQRGFTLTMTVFGILAVILLIVSFKNINEKVEMPGSDQVVPFKKAVKSMKGNVPLYILFFVSFIYTIGFIMKTQTTVYYLSYNLNKPELVGVILGLSSLNVISYFIMPSLAKWIGKRNIMILGLALMSVGQIGFYFSGSTTPFIIATLIGVIGQGFLMASIFSMIADVVDYGEWKSGIRAQGLVSTVPVFSFKIGMGIGGALSAWVLSFGNYVPNQIQTASALTAIEISFIWIPLVGFILGIVALLFYKLDKQSEQMMIDLNARRATAKIVESGVAEIKAQ
ncbi:MFS transporter [Oceanobacillus sp. J11TS1]|uniref:MFS transporter n=1 Tax=Oceanobacillus sp. J11TS1 TaxID=2807191 RepID=UPI001B01FEA7|nr:MFS transporter [Oceanobacillus sp. J11TS1]GIO23757.1 MFS transporter [Oceanobacillus sp. J11TS1]